MKLIMLFLMLEVLEPEFILLIFLLMHLDQVTQANLQNPMKKKLICLD